MGISNHIPIIAVELEQIVLKLFSQTLFMHDTIILGGGMDKISEQTKTSQLPSTWAPELKVG